MSIADTIVHWAVLWMFFLNRGYVLVNGWEVAMEIGMLRLKNKKKEL